MDNLGYLRGYIFKSAQMPSKGEYEDMKREALDYINPGAGSMIGHTGSKVVDWVKSNPDKAMFLAALMGGATLGGMKGRKKYHTVTTPTAGPMAKGALLGGTVAGGALAYKNRDKILDFLKNIKDKNIG